MGRVTKPPTCVCDYRGMERNRGGRLPLPAALVWTGGALAVVAVIVALAVVIVAPPVSTPEATPASTPTPPPTSTPAATATAAPAAASEPVREAFHYNLHASGDVARPGTYALLADAKDLQGRVEAGWFFRAGGLLIHESDAGGVSRAAFYETVAVGDVFELWVNRNCFGRFRIAGILEEPAGMPRSRLFASEPIASSYALCFSSFTGDYPEGDVLFRWRPKQGVMGADGIRVMLRDEPVTGPGTFRVAPYRPLVVDVPAGMTLASHGHGLVDVATGAKLEFYGGSTEESGRHPGTRDRTDPDRDVDALFDEILASARTVAIPPYVPPAPSSCVWGRAVAEPFENPGLLADCDALLALRDQLAGTGSLNWSAMTPIASWDGVTVGGSPPRVTVLDVADRDLTGEITGWLGHLTELVELRLEGNALTGAIPSKLGRLEKLSRISLAGNSLTGCAPPAWHAVEDNDLAALGMPFCEPPAVLSPRADAIQGGRTYVLDEHGDTRVSFFDLPEGINLSGITSDDSDCDRPCPASVFELVEESSGSVLLLEAHEGAEYRREVTASNDRERRRVEEAFDAIAASLWFVPATRFDGLASPGQAPSRCQGFFSGSNGALARDCDALLALGDTLAGTGRLNWSETVPITDWEGVTVGGTPLRVTALALVDRGLTGELTGWLGSLTELTELRLEGNALTGRIPSSLGQLERLTHVSLSGSSLAGCLPPAWGRVAGGDLPALGIPFCGPPLEVRGAPAVIPGTVRTATLAGGATYAWRWSDAENVSVVFDLPEGIWLKEVVVYGDSRANWWHGHILFVEGETGATLWVSMADGRELGRTLYGDARERAFMGKVFDRLAGSLWFDFVR